MSIRRGGIGYIKVLGKEFVVLGKRKFYLRELLALSWYQIRAPNKSRPFDLVTVPFYSTKNRTVLYRDKTQTL